MRIKRDVGTHIFSLPVSNTSPAVQVRISDGRHFLLLTVAPADPENAAFFAEYPIPFSENEIEIDAPELFFRHLVWKDASSPRRPEKSVPRQAFHFTPPKGWMNDPNGLFFLNGKWHLFYQSNPLSAIWGNMHWAHAVSSDLIHWEDKGLALWPDSNGTIFSGSAVVDQKNWAGFGKNAVLLFYTNNGYDGKGSQNLAVSTDGGISFRKYENNPILPNLSGRCDRDPQVAFDPESGVWRMCLYLGDEEKREFLLFASKNLLNWEKTDSYQIPGGRECPGIQRMFDEETGEWKWLFFEANGFYRIGTISSEGRILFEGPVRRFLIGDAYAGQCFQNAPDGRIIFIAWLKMPGGAAGSWAGCMTLPMELRLRGGLLLLHPAVELPSSPFHAAGRTRMGNGIQEILVDPLEHRISCRGKTWNLPETLAEVKGRIFQDRFSLEYFDDSGHFMAAFYIPDGSCEN